MRHRPLSFASPSTFRRTGASCSTGGNSLDAAGFRPRRDRISPGVVDGIYYDGSAGNPRPENPTLEDAQNAWRYILDIIFCEFPFRPTWIRRSSLPSS